MKIIFLIIIIICLGINMYFPIATAKNNNTNTKYLALGDSISYGYGLANIENDSFPEKVRQEYNIEKLNFKNLSVSGMTCEQFSQYIKTSEVTNAIKEAKLLSISIGSNELLGILTEYIGNTNNTTEFYYKVANLYNFITSKETENRIESAILSYKKHWDKSIEYIKKINPNISIIALEFYNPYYGVYLGNYDFGTITGEAIEKMNEVLWEKSDFEKKYKIAEIYNDFNTSETRLTNVNTNIENFNLDPHPNVLGHEKIYQRIAEKKIDIYSEAVQEPSQTRNRSAIYTITFIIISIAIVMFLKNKIL